MSLQSFYSPLLSTHGPAPTLLLQLLPAACCALPSPFCFSNTSLFLTALTDLMLALGLSGLSLALSVSIHQMGVNWSREPRLPPTNLLPLFQVLEKHHKKEDWVF